MRRLVDYKEKTMKTRIATLLSVVLACLALSLSGCGKDDKKNDDKKENKDKKKDDKKKDDKKKDDKKKDDKGGDDTKAMMAMADQIVKMAGEMCECKDKACAEAKNKEMDALTDKGDEMFGGKGKDDKPPQEVMDKIMPAMTKAGECMEKLMTE